jgi:hypothetical protein
LDLKLIETGLEGNGFVVTGIVIPSATVAEHAALALVGDSNPATAEVYSRHAEERAGGLERPTPQANREGEANDDATSILQDRSLIRSDCRGAVRDVARLPRANAGSQQEDAYKARTYGGGVV